MVGSIVDPAVDDDGLGLTGPGAPGQSFSGAPAEHPVPARLLEKARAASGETTATETRATTAPIPDQAGDAAPAPSTTGAADAQPRSRRAA